MRNLFTAAAAAAMMFGATAGYAQNATTDEFYLTGEGDAMRVMGGDNTEGVVVLGDETYAVPADCPEGSFYRSSENMVTACGEGGASFEMAEPAAGETRRALTRRDNGDNRQDTAGGTNTGGGGSSPAAGPGSTGTSGSNSGQGSGSTDTSTGMTGGTAGGTSSGSNAGQGSGSSDTSTGTGTAPQ